MSGICGIIRWDGGPVSREELARMAQAASYRGRDGIQYHVEGSVGLAYLSTEVTPESVGEYQPVRRPGGALLLADLRLDNRDELGARGLQHDRAAGSGDAPTDAEVLLHALMSDPRGAPGRVLGDFAWALWDPRARELKLCRDAMGMRPLYYRVEPSRVLFASEAKQILAADGVPRELDLTTVAWHLCGMQVPADRVYYRGITALLPGEEARLRPSGRAERRIVWEPDPGRRIRYPSDGEYAEQLRGLLVESMRVRLRARSPVGVALSGGLDSGAVAAIGGGLRLGNAPAPPWGSWPEVRAYTWAFTELPQCDERAQVHRVADPYGIPVSEIPAESTAPFAGYPEHGPDEDDPHITMYQPFVDAVSEAAAGDGVSVLFTGMRGDMIAGGDVYDLHGRVVRGAITGLRTDLRLLRRHTSQSRKGTLLVHLVRPLLSLCLPPPLLRRPGEPARRAATHVSRRFLERAGLPHHDPVDLASEPWRDAARRDRYRHIYSPLLLHVIQALDRQRAKYGLTAGDPWSDRRLAEFVLACPQDVLQTVSRPKRLAWIAISQLMPPAVAATASKVIPEPLYEQALRERSTGLVRDLMTSTRAAALGCIDEPTLRAAFDSFVAGRGPQFDLWSTLTLEIWLRRYWDGNG